MNYKKLTKAELVKTLTSLQTISASAQSVDAQQRLLHDLQVYKIELEMQNRELRETQQKLEASRNRYADLYDFAPISYVTFDKNGAILEVNLTGAAMLGRERLRLLDKPFIEWVAQNDAQKWRKHLQRCKSAHEIVTTELCLDVGSGKLIEVQLSSLPVQDPEWLTTVYRTAIMDITERKRREEILQKQAEQRLRYQGALLKLTRMDNSDWLAAQKAITEEDAKVLEVERVSIWLFSADRSEIVCEDLYRSSRNIHEKGLSLQVRKYPKYFHALEKNRIITANDAAGDPRTSEFKKGYLKSFGISSVMEVPVWLHRKVVGIVCHEHTGSRREWKQEEQEFAGSVADLVSLALETAERKRAEEALRESEERFRLLANGAPVLIWVNGLAGCDFVNRAYLEFLGVSGDVEVQHFNWTQFVHPEDRERYVGAYLDCFARRVPFEAQFRFLRHDGKYRWIKSSGLPHFSSAGEFLGYVGSSLDITDIKDAEERIRELNARLEARVRERTAQLEASNDDLQREIAQRARAEEALRKNEAHFRALSENASDIISVFDAGAVIRYQSPSVERVLGYKPEDLIGRNSFDFIHPDDVPRLVEIFTEMLKTPGASQSSEFRIRHQDGSWRFLESFGKTLRDETGELMIVVNSRDLTERKRAEEQVQFLYRTTQAINQAADFHEALAIALREICTLTGWEYGEAWVPSADGTRLECSTAWHGDSGNIATFRKQSAEISYKVNESLPGRVWVSSQVEWMNDLAGQPPEMFRRASMTRELGLKTAVGLPILAAGEKLAVLLFFSTAPRAAEPYLMALFSTVAVQLGATLRRKQAEQELLSSREQLRNLSMYLQTAREEERTHIAREIHDELGQMLTVLKIDLSWLVKRLPASEESLLAKIGVMSNLVDMTIATVKRISMKLRPGLLDKLGLAEAIEWQAGQFREHTGIDCEIALPADNGNLDRERSTILFRIVQETLTNVARHAQATNVKISLMRNTHKLLLKVRDNGKGITPEQIFHPHSFGLIGIRERVHPWGGKIKIKGLAGKGTVVFVSLPVNLSPPHSVTIKTSLFAPKG